MNFQKLVAGQKVILTNGDVAEIISTIKENKTVVIIVGKHDIVGTIFWDDVGRSLITDFDIEEYHE